MFRSKITGIGHYVPERVVTNAEMEKHMDTTDAWIRERSGIQERRFANPSTDTTANMGTRAARVAIERAGITPNDIDFIIFATLSPDFYFPGPGVTVQKELGIKTVGALDIRNQCSGFIYGLSVADQFIRTGMYKTILVIGSEIQSNAIDLSTRGRAMAVLFADGAGAAVLQATDNTTEGILSTHLHSEGEHAEQLYMRYPGISRPLEENKKAMEEFGGYHPEMNGNFVFKHAVTRFAEVIDEALKANGYQATDIDMLVPHQANLRITQFVQRQMGLPDEKVYSNIERFGNTTAATIPIALSELWEQGKIKKGDLVTLAAFGSGFTWASALIRW